MAQRQMFNFVFIFVLMSFKEIIGLAQTSQHKKKIKCIFINHITKLGMVE